MVVRNVMRAPLTWPEDMNRSATAVDEERKKEEKEEEEGRRRMR